MLYLVVVDLGLGAGCWDGGSRVVAHRQSTQSGKGPRKYSTEHDASYCTPSRRHSVVISQRLNDQPVQSRPFSLPTLVASSSYAEEQLEWCCCSGVAMQFQRHRTPSHMKKLAATFCTKSSIFDCWFKKRYFCIHPVFKLWLPPYEIHRFFIKIPNSVNIKAVCTRYDSSGCSLRITLPPSLLLWYIHVNVL